MKISACNLNEISNKQLKFAVICASYKGKWIFVRQRDRETWEIPGGHREEKEEIGTTASRELFEETGALKYLLEHVCDYSVTVEKETSYGRLFYADVTLIGPLPESEIGEICFSKRLPEQLTYKEIQPHLQKCVLDYLKGKAMALLDGDRARNINIMNFISSYALDTVDFEGQSLLVRGRSDEDWVYISSQSEEELLKLRQKLDEEDKCFAVLEDWMLPHITAGKEIRSRLSSMKMVFEPGHTLPPVRSVISDLTVSDAQTVYDYSKYKEFIDVAYINERILHGTGLGIVENGRLAAWAITHDDGAIGFLNVLEEFRRKGYGTDIMTAMVKRLLKKDEIPFVHIEEENKASLNLAKKVGFSEAGRVHWIKLN